MLAAVTMEWTEFQGTMCPAWTCAVYLRTDSTRSLCLEEGKALNLGFDVLMQEHPTDNLAPIFDNCLVACRRQAKILVAHNFADDLASFAPQPDGSRLPGVDSVRQQWTDRKTKGRGMAKMFDTGHDVPGAPLLDDSYDLLRIGVRGINDRYIPDSPVAPGPLAFIAGSAIKETLAIALVAAAYTGKYDWPEAIDLDQVVTDHAWDRLADLDASPSATAVP